jgi:alpha-beta hydrolase superfamily lysophospholipase
MYDEQRQTVLPELRRWRLAPDAWRLSGRVTPGRLERYLRFRSAKGLPRSLKARFRAMRIPEQTITDVLGSIRSLSGWMDAWNLAAQRFLTEARGEERSGRWQEAAIARINAAMCFHIAHLVTDSDPRTLRTLRASSVTTFAQAVPRLMPEVRKISLPWRTRSLPAFVAVPTTGRGPYPLYVLLNGATTCKEELLLWALPLLDQEIAVMTIDWPGTGESASFTAPLADCDDLTDGVFEFVASQSELDPDMVAIGGISLGGSVAIRCAAYDRRLLGAMAVTPPYDPLAWWGYVNPLVRLQLMTLAVDSGSAEDVVADFGLVDLIPRVRSPLLVFGAGRDMVVPPEESIALVSAAGDLATLVWYPDGGHGLYSELGDWIGLTGDWVNSLVGREDVSEEPEALPDVEPLATRIAPPIVAATESQTPARSRSAVAEPVSTRVEQGMASARSVPRPAAPVRDQDEGDDDFIDDLWDDQG